MQCGADRSILQTLKSRQPYSEECRIRIHANIDGGVLEFRAYASLLENQGQDIVLLVMRDISAEKRRKALEKTLFYEVRSSLQNLYGLSQLLMNEPNNHEIKEFVRRSSQNLFLQVSQELDLLSLLLSAERGEIQVRPEILSTADLLHALCEELSDMAEARGIQIRLAETAPPVIETDLTLLRAVLRQIVKNAVESTQRGETVTLSAIQQTDEAVLTIHNPGAIPDSVKEQIFMRSFSTKEERGRGIGTYSAKLFTERYLQGHISFTSTVEGGTTFTVRIPHKSSTLDDYTSEAPQT
jgi:signal transduction histidine kinase